MELYTLDSNFQPKEVVDDFMTALWVERYTKSGDVTITAEPTSAMVSKLAEGTYLSLKDSQEVMLLDTALIENGVLKVTGATLDDFLNHRMLYLTAFNVPAAIPISGKPGYIMSHLVDIVCVSDTTYTTTHGLHSQSIPNLTLGAVDLSGPTVDTSIPFGQLYPYIAQIADTYNVGFSLYLASFTPPASYSLKFKTYIGRDLTSAQSVNPVVRFSPNVDSLADIKSLKSIAQYRNSALVTVTQLGDIHLAGMSGTPNFVDIPLEVDVNDGATATGLARRVLMVDGNDVANGLDIAYWTATEARTYQLYNALIQKGKDALANNNYAKVVDGQITPQSPYKFGTDYFLGDIVELSAYGLNTSARITEYIRSQDQEGAKSYPTIVPV